MLLDHSISKNILEGLFVYWLYPKIYKKVYSSIVKIQWIILHQPIKKRISQEPIIIEETLFIKSSGLRMAWQLKCKGFILFILGFITVSYYFQTISEAPYGGILFLGRFFNRGNGRYSCKQRKTMYKFTCQAAKLMAYFHVRQKVISSSLMFCHRS